MTTVLGHRAIVVCLTTTASLLATAGIACSFLGPDKDAGLHQYNAMAGLGRNYLHGMVFLGVSPHYSPNGSQLVFAGLVDGSSDIFLHDIRLNKTRRLTSTPWWKICPAFLHSSKYIAFVSDQNASDGEFYVMSPDRSAVRRIAPGLLFRHDGSAISQTGPQPSPSEDSFAFAAWDGAGHQGVYVHSIATGKIQRMSRVDRDAGAPAWSAAGAYLYFSQARESDPRAMWDVIRVPMDGGPPETLISGHKIGVLGTTSDEKRVIVSQDDGSGAKLYVASASDQWQLHDWGLCGAEPVWSAHAGAVVFTRDSDTDRYHYDLWRLDLGGTPRKITDIRGYLLQPAFAWDGTEIVFDVDQTTAPARGFGRIYSVGIDGNDFRMLCNVKN